MGDSCCRGWLYHLRHILALVPASSKSDEVSTEHEVRFLFLGNQIFSSSGSLCMNAFGEGQIQDAIFRAFSSQGQNITSLPAVLSSGLLQ